MAPSEDSVRALTEQVAALTARVYRLEQMSSTAAEPALRTIENQSPIGSPSSPNPLVENATFDLGSAEPKPRSIFRSFPQIGRRNDSPALEVNFERRIGQYWLNRIGIVAMLIGVSYFLKYAFENNWIGPSGRIAIGVLAGIGLVVWSEWFRKRGHRAFSYSLKAIGIGTLYLSMWSAFQVYHLIPASIAFVAMAIVTGATIAMALGEDAEVLASFALIGGFATPVLLSTGQNHEIALFSYICLLDLAMFAMVIFKPWRPLLWGSFVGTVALYSGWQAEFYSRAERPTTVLFAALFAAIFAAIPLSAKQHTSTRFASPSITLTVLPLLNAAAFFLALYEMYNPERVTLTWYALALAAVYLAISNWFRQRFMDQDAKFITLLHVAIAIAFITIAIPLKLDAEWITIGWLIESAVLLWISVRTQTAFLRYLAVAALILGIVRLLLYDTYQTDTLILNARFATYLVAIAILAGVVKFGKPYASERELPLLDLAVIVLNLLALIALTREASDYFDRNLSLSYRTAANAVSFVQMRIAREFSYSAIWLVYGAVLMAVGFTRRSAFIRWQALVLIAMTIGKVFLYDVSALDKGYRIISFFALGAVLLGISFIYQRDWLKLSSSSSPASHKGHL